MAAVQEATLLIKGHDAEAIAELRISLLPRPGSPGGPSSLLDMRGDAEGDPTLAPIQLLEGAEYRFEWKTPGRSGPVTAEPREVFQPDTHDGRTGRLRPGLFTGAVPIQLFIDGALIGEQEVEVRSRKLDYLSQYRWMLRDIADQMTEVIMDRFAVASTGFGLDDTRDAVTLYERFAFLRALISSERFRLALAEITRRPHVAWVERHESSPPGQGIRADSYALRQLSRPGPRALWADGPIPTLPARLDRRRTEATHDTTPNRFVKFALERWQQVLSDIEAALGAERSTPAVERGRREVHQLLSDLNAMLSHELFRELRRLHRFPADDQVLQKREGYRDVFRAYLEFELAARLSWAGGQRIYGAGQKDVASLYEYWAFLKLADLLASMMGADFDLASLVELRSNGLNLTLREGHAQVIAGTVERNGRKLALELWFNRTFSRSKPGLPSWSRPMRPDYSLSISPAQGESARFAPVVLHFDAKYRVDAYEELFGGTGDDEAMTAEAAAEQRGAVLRADLLKMHAYRDAIRRSAGAYVLYPGTEAKEPFREYHELLPGLGAFTLRPTESGEASGSGTLKAFLDEVLDHLSLQTTQHERGRYWIEEAYAPYNQVTGTSPVAPFLRAPPADTMVLLGYVKSREHWDWIASRGLYNLRGKGRRGAVEGKASLLACTFLVLSCPSLDRCAIAEVTGEFETYGEEEMRALGYPDPKGTYVCAQIRLIDDTRWARLLQSDDIEALRRSRVKIPGAPVAVTWLELAARGVAPSS